MTVHGKSSRHKMIIQHIAAPCRSKQSRKLYFTSNTPLWLCPYILVGGAFDRPIRFRSVRASPVCIDPMADRRSDRQIDKAGLLTCDIGTAFFDHPTLQRSSR
jgi:hypothetical protein